MFRGPEEVLADSGLAALPRRVPFVGGLRLVRKSGSAERDRRPSERPRLPGPSRPRRRRTHSGRQSHRQATSDVSGRRGRHCRSERSIDHSLRRRFFRRGDARPRWLRQSDHLHSIHSWPTIAQDYTKDRDRYLPDRACTSHTKPQAARHSGRADLHSADGDDDRIGLPRSTRARKAQPLQRRWYALIQVLSRGKDRFNAIKTALEWDAREHPAARFSARNSIPAQAFK
jgi:hypothetical protein